jgi:hypothetical protein
MGRTEELRKKLGLPLDEIENRVLRPQRTGHAHLDERLVTISSEKLHPSPIFHMLSGLRFDFIDPIKFEELVMGLFESFGFKGQLTPPSGDHGIDIELKGSSGNLILVQCKRYQQNLLVSPKELREFLGAITFTHATEGYFVTTSGFTEQCRVFAKDQPLHLVDGVNLQKLLLFAETLYRKTSYGPSFTRTPEELIREYLPQ